MLVTATMRPAWELVNRALFRPAQFNTWISFGVIFFLQSCLETDGGGNYNLNLPGRGSGFPGGAPPGGPGGPPTIDPSVLSLVIVGALVVAIPIVVVALWLGTRGQMMAIRSVANARAEIGASWNGTRDAGYALFRFHLVLTVISGILALPIAAFLVITGLRLVRGDATWDDALPTFAVLALLLFVLWVPLAIVKSLVRNFVAPIMLRDGTSAVEAWRKFWSVGKNSVGPMIGFLLLRAVVEIAAGMLGLAVGYLTCCIGFLPVIRQTQMSPWHVFERAWSLEVLASMGPGFDVIQREPVGWYGPYAQPIPPPR
jgi:hypothetical protein